MSSASHRKSVFRRRSPGFLCVDDSIPGTEKQLFAGEEPANLWRNSHCHGVVTVLSLQFEGKTNHTKRVSLGMWKRVRLEGELEALDLIMMSPLLNLWSCIGRCTGRDRWQGDVLGKATHFCDACSTDFGAFFVVLLRGLTSNEDGQVGEAGEMVCLNYHRCGQPHCVGTTFKQLP